MNNTRQPPSDPYRLFFPLGIVMGMAGVAIWPAYHWGITEGYSGQAHAFVQLHCFLYAFIAGFLLTAVPRFTGTLGPARSIQYFLSATVIAELVAFESYAFTAGHLLFVLAHGTVLAVIARCFVKRRHPPPETFVLVGLGLVAGAAAAFINAASAMAWISPGLDLLGKRLLTEGMGLLLVLGVGGFLGPRLLGFARLPDLQKIEKGGDRPNDQRPTQWRGGLNAVCGLALLGTVIAGYGSGYPLDFLVWVRAALVTLVVAVNVELWRLPAIRTTLAWSVWIAHWFLLTGLWLVAIFRNYHTDLLHVLFMGAFTPLILAVATRVVLSHGGHALTEERRSWPLRIGIAASLVAMFARLTVIVASTPHSYYSHLAWAAVIWIIGMAFWGIYLLRKIRSSAL